MPADEWVLARAAAREGRLGLSDEMSGWGPVDSQLANDSPQTRPGTARARAARVLTRPVRYPHPGRQECRARLTAALLCRIVHAERHAFDTPGHSASRAPEQGASQPECHKRIGNGWRASACARAVARRRRGLRVATDTGPHPRIGARYGGLRHAAAGKRPRRAGAPVRLGAPPAQCGSPSLRQARAAS